MSTVALIESTVRARLLRGELAPGARLRQDELASELGVSKIPVREALQRLAASGLLRFETNRGAVVPALTSHDAIENYSLRRAIEPQLLERALPRLTIVDLAEAEFALAATDLSITESNWVFHRSLYRSAEWPRGLAIAEILHTAVAPYVRVYTEELEGAANSDSQHHELLDACRNGELETALDILSEHLDDAQRALVHLLDDR